MRTTLQRFEEKYIPEPNTGCWIWMASTQGHPAYGRFYFERKQVQAHHAAWMLLRGTPPKGMFGLHRCDVPLCVNPDHIFWGTQKDNVDDARRKGRFVYNSANLKQMQS